MKRRNLSYRTWIWFLTLRVVVEDYLEVALGFGNWNKQTAQQLNKYVSDILRTSTKSFDNKLGQDAVKGFYKVDANGYNVAVYIYKSGPNAGRIASVVRLSNNQMIKFGLK
ncbi:hypothetical protein P4S95_07970 [Aneurinibacillus aneurinilyticus]|uniref:hypothetical protein n=1 Tax=Aneurinibacillus aneurinilyticus TaxID=1391 RepID=UPI002E1ADB6F|nr:hypothetical protein [Aneurinibacillus aneurinilyticus]